MKSVSSGLFLLGIAILLHSGCAGSAGCRQTTSETCVTSCQPDVPIAASFNDSGSDPVPLSPVVESCWWQLFQDPDLDLLVEQVRSQNYSLQASRFRIKEAEHLRNVAASLPAVCKIPGLGSAASRKLPPDLCTAELQICERIHDHRFAVNALIAETATIYIQIRSLDERIELARQNIELQKTSLEIAEKKFNEGRSTELDVTQAQSNLSTIRSMIPQLELARRKYLNALCVLVGLPPGDVPEFSDHPGRIPEIPEQLLVGLPNEMVCRRDDLRAAAARYQMAARAAESRPAGCLSIFNRVVAAETVCVKQAIAQQALASYRNLVLIAQREVEDGIAEFVKNSKQYQLDLATATADEASARLAMAISREGQIDMIRVLSLQSKMNLAQNQVIETRAEIALARSRLIARWESAGPVASISITHAIRRTGIPCVRHR